MDAIVTSESDLTEIFPRELIEEIGSHLDCASLSHFAFVNRVCYQCFAFRIPALGSYSKVAARYGYLRYFQMMDQSVLDRVSNKCAVLAYTHGHTQVFERLLLRKNALIIRANVKRWLKFGRWPNCIILEDSTFYHIGKSASIDSLNRLVANGVDLNSSPQFLYCLILGSVEKGNYEFLKLLGEKKEIDLAKFKRDAPWYTCGPKLMHFLYFATDLNCARWLAEVGLIEYNRFELVCAARTEEIFHDLERFAKEKLRREFPMEKIDIESIIVAISLSDWAFLQRQHDRLTKIQEDYWNSPFFESAWSLVLADALCQESDQILSWVREMYFRDFKPSIWECGRTYLYCCGGAFRSGELSRLEFCFEMLNIKLWSRPWWIAAALAIDFFDDISHPIVRYFVSKELDYTETLNEEDSLGKWELKAVRRFHLVATRKRFHSILKQFRDFRSDKH